MSDMTDMTFEEEMAKDFMSTEEFNEVLNQATDYVMDFFQQYTQEEDIMPMVTVHGKKKPEDERTTLSLGLQGFGSDKIEEMKEVGRVFARKGVEEMGGAMPWAVMFICGAYMKTMDKEQDEEYSNGDLKDDEDAEEIITVQGMTVDGRTNFAIFSIKRRKNDTIKKVELDKFGPHSETAEGGVNQDSLIKCFYKGFAEVVFDEEGKSDFKKRVYEE